MVYHLEDLTRLFVMWRLIWLSKVTPSVLRHNRSKEDTTKKTKGVWLHTCVCQCACPQLFLSRIFRGGQSLHFTTVGTPVLMWLKRSLRAPSLEWVSDWVAGAHNSCHAIEAAKHVSGSDGTWCATSAAVFLEAAADLRYHALRPGTHPVWLVWFALQT